MSAQAIVRGFKPRLKFPDYRVNLADFKGHQSKALTRMKQLSPQVDLVLELRDARAPISTRNELLQKVFRDKERLVLYTKRDKSMFTTRQLSKMSFCRNEKFRMVDCKSSSDLNGILTSVRKLYQSMYPRPPLGLRMMIVGMPNVGKSTMVNGLRSLGMGKDLSMLVKKKKKRVAQVGEHPGVTRSTSEIIRISRDPEVLLYDTPGVLIPHVKNSETMLGLSLAGIISEVNRPDPVILSDYMLYLMNIMQPDGRIYRRHLNHPTNNIYELLESMARKEGNFIRRRGETHKTPNYVGTAIQLIQEMKYGRLGKWCFDIEAIQELQGRAK